MLFRSVSQSRYPIKSEADKEKEMDAAYERQQVEEKERIHRANMATLKTFSPSSKNKKEPEQMGYILKFCLVNKD